jgi:hypothetical protein
VDTRYAITNNGEATRKPTEEFGSLAYKGERFFFSILPTIFLGFTQPPYILNTKRFFFGIKATGT